VKKKYKKKIPSIRLSSPVVVVVWGEVGLVEVDGKRVLTRQYGGVCGGHGGHELQGRVSGAK
jgi:hypothetical protein